jgi:glycogen operon protein
MSPDDWNSGIKSLAVFLNGEAIPEPDLRGERVIDDSFLLCFNAHGEPVEFLLPGGDYGLEWTTVIDTFDPPEGGNRVVTAGATITVPARTVIVFRKTA